MMKSADMPPSPATESQPPLPRRSQVLNLLSTLDPVDDVTMEWMLDRVQQRAGRR